MRAATIFVALSAFVSAASAAALSKRQGPTCVMQCIFEQSAVVQCSTSDAPCLCQSSAFITGVAGCFAAACSAADADAGVKLGEELCRSVGFSVSIPAAASSALAGGASTVPSGSSAPSTAAASTSAPATPSVASTSAPVAASSSAVSSAPPASSAPASTGGAAILTGSVALAGLTLVGSVMSLLA